jgi:hypothetical protein
MSNPRNVERAAWRNMLHRCHNEQHRDYPNYGGRGITVCAEWRSKEKGFEAFFAHVGPRKSDDLSLDRIDNSKGYQPGNVEWRDRSTQQSNKRFENLFGASLEITIGGRTQSAKEWQKETGINSATIIKRWRAGKTDDEILSKDRLPRGSRKSQERNPDIYL